MSMGSKVKLLLNRDHISISRPRELLHMDLFDATKTRSLGEHGYSSCCR